MDQEMDMRNITAVNLNEEQKDEEQKTKISDELVNRGFLDPKSIVKLVSSDGQVFALEYDCVMQSGTIKSLLQSNPNWLENKSGIVEFPCIDAKILSKVVEYMVFKKLHGNELVEEFFIEPEMALDMMLAADYLDL